MHGRAYHAYRSIIKTEWNKQISSDLVFFIINNYKLCLLSRVKVMFAINTLKRCVASVVVCLWNTHSQQLLQMLQRIPSKLPNLHVSHEGVMKQRPYVTSCSEQNWYKYLIRNNTLSSRHGVTDEITALKICIKHVLVIITNASPCARKSTVYIYSYKKILHETPA